jgi:ubiquitin C-terminal hydrolase
MNNNVYCGLNNHGNTCFFNSALQNLMRCSVFINFIENINCSHELIQIFKEIISDYKKNNNSSISPIKLVKYYAKLNDNYSVGNQDDAEEVITLLIGKIDDVIKEEIKEGRLEDEILKGSITVRTMIEYLFGINIRTETKCSECNNVSVYNVIEFKIRVPVSSQKNLNEILTGYSNIEKMQGDEQYFCSNCNKKVDAFKLDKVLKTPKYLHVQLKRFETDSRRRQHKIDDPVIIPSKLKISTKDYDLRGSVHHMGSINGGHYIYHYNKNDESNFKNWICLDDSRISTKDITNDINKGYVFLYVRQK